MQALSQRGVKGFDVYIVVIFLLGFDLLEDLDRHACQGQLVRLVRFPPAFLAECARRAR